jgi:hypothetical protein
MSRARIACAIPAALLISACARITASNADLPAPAGSIELTASSTDGAFSSIPGKVAVQAATLKHRAGPAGAPTYLSTGTNGRAVTYRFSTPPTEFVNGDVLTVTWTADAVQTFRGSHYTVQKTATYSFHGRVGK